MKRFSKLAVVPVAMVYLLSAGCSPPHIELRHTRSSEPEATPLEETTPRAPIDPWKAASEWPVPDGPVGDAQRFLLNAPAYQYTSEGENLSTHRRDSGEAQVVHNEALKVESDGQYGRNGIITDGKREWVYFDGRYGLEPGDAAATMRDQLKGCSLQRLLEQCEPHVTALKPEQVNGIEADVYALSAHVDAGLSPPPWALGGGHARVWIAKADHRPLKVEWKANHVLSANSKPVQQIEVRTYHYDPNVKVTFPAMP